MKRRLTAALLCLCLLGTLFPATALAQGETDSGPPPAESALCEHHPQHDENCGYTAGSAGASCTHAHGQACYAPVTNCVHTHTAECYPAESAPEDPAAPAEPAEAEPTACAHVCREESGCITQVLNCQHAHDMACGYAPAVEGTPCGYVCELCHSQEGGEAEDTAPAPEETAPEETEPTEPGPEETEPEETAPTEPDPELTAPEPTEPAPEAECLCAQRCTEDRVSADCPVCSAEGADLSACLGAVPAAALAAAAARAQTTVEYVFYNRSLDGKMTRVKSSVPATVVESSDTTWDGGWYVVNQNVNFDSVITVQGDVSLILADGCKLTSSHEITVNEGNILRIYGQKEGTGELYAYGARRLAVIGGGDGQDCGTITIHGGKITANGGSNGQGAGIGGGREGDGGDITIYGGTVTANGGTGNSGQGAGIGGGNGGSGGTIDIYGGTVMATGGWHGAGIGGGSGGSGGTINITGGDVTATGHADAGHGAGIGGGNGGSSGTITITGGEVEATGSYFGGAGIGGGANGSGDTINITGGEVRATGGRSGVGIGGGRGGSGGTINISGGEVRATGGSSGGAGIGYGGTITITGGMVTASARVYGDVGISGGEITISGGTVTATGGSMYGLASAGIGGTFSTGADGNAIIYANSIDAGGDQSQWSGIIFQGNSGQVYGKPTLAEDFTVEKNRTLTIADGASLTIPAEKTLTNQTTIHIAGSGVLTNHGTLDNGSGLVTIAGDDSVVNDGTIIKGPQSTPGAGEGYTIHFDTETLTIDSGYEVFTAQSDGTEIASDSSLSGYLGQTFYIRKAEYITQKASDWAELTIPTRQSTPAAPQVTDRTHVSITIAAADGAAYRLGDTGQWQTGTDGSLTFSGLTAGQTYTIYARCPAVTTGSSPAFGSEETSIQVTTKAAPGQAPVVTGIVVTDTTITLPDNATWEYSTDGQTWDSTRAFTGLNPATAYTYYVRVKGTDTTMESQIAAVTVYTAYATPAAGTGYTIHFDAETLTIDSGYEVNTAEDFTGTEVAGGGSLSDYTGQTLYIRHAADAGGAPASGAAELPIPARPATPQGVTGGLLNISGVDTTMEYSTDRGAAWTAFTDETASSISAGTYLVRYAAVAGTSFASESVEVTVTQPSSGGGATTYPVTVAVTEHGTVTVSPRNARRNATVTITVKPDAGYELERLSVLDSGGDDLELRARDDGRYIFTMPAGRVTVEAAFAEIAPEQLPFRDVSESFWAYDAIRYVYENGLMAGTSGAAFSPNASISRQQIWMILARLAGADPANMAEARQWAMDFGISDGTAPGAAVTRQQLAALLYRYAQSQGYDVGIGADTNILSYTDALTVSGYAIPAMQWACGAGVLYGTSDGRLNPTGTATRAQFAVMLERFCELDK